MPNNPQQPQTPQDKTTGDTYVTEKNLADILKKLNQSLGDDALKEIIEQQKEALEQLYAEELQNLQRDVYRSHESKMLVTNPIVV